MAKDKFLQLLGEITVEASALEYCAAYYVTLARQQGASELRDILKRAGGARQEAKKLLRELEEASVKSEPQADQLRRLSFLLPRMDQLMERRNRLVHAVEVLRISDRLDREAESLLWHPRSDSALSVSEDDMRALTEDLRGLAGTWLRATTYLPNGTSSR